MRCGVELRDRSTAYIHERCRDSARDKPRERKGERSLAVTVHRAPVTAEIALSSNDRRYVFLRLAARERARERERAACRGRRTNVSPYPRRPRRRRARSRSPFNRRVRAEGTGFMVQVTISALASKPLLYIPSRHVRRSIHRSYVRYTPSYDRPPGGKLSRRYYRQRNDKSNIHRGLSR